MLVYFGSLTGPHIQEVSVGSPRDRFHSTWAVFYTGIHSPGPALKDLAGVTATERPAKCLGYNKESRG